MPPVARIVRRPTPARRQRHRAILWIEAIGFCVLIGGGWAVEFAGLPHKLYSLPEGVDWMRLGLRTSVVLTVWVAVHLSTRQILKRLHQLEDFLLVCSWCRRIGHEGSWVTMEEYFGSKFATETSHGVCPDCSKRLIDSAKVELEEKANVSTP